MKFFFQIPLHRMAMIMRMQGLDVSEGALTGMLKKLAPLFLPLYLLLTEVNRSENHWHVDETGWMRFVQVPDKQGWHWWLKGLRFTTDSCVRAGSFPRKPSPAETFRKRRQGHHELRPVIRLRQTGRHDRGVSESSLLGTLSP